jgi:hypothetical protein
MSRIVRSEAVNTKITTGEPDSNLFYTGVKQRLYNTINL